jgi:AcrR family transcriptional regulator
MSDIANSAGISRQALYLHFPNRTELLIATTHYIDRVKDVNRRLARSRSVSSGLERLEAYVEAWGNYIPEIYGVANALIVMGATDNEARLAWNGRLAAVREGCEAVVVALSREGRLSDRLSSPEAIDVLCAHLSGRKLAVSSSSAWLDPDALCRGNETNIANNFGPVTVLYACRYKI